MSSRGETKDRSTQKGRRVREFYADKPPFRLTSGTRMVATVWVDFAYHQTKCHACGRKLSFDERRLRLQFNAPHYWYSPSGAPLTRRNDIVTYTHVCSECVENALKSGEAPCGSRS